MNKYLSEDIKRISFSKHILLPFIIIVIAQFLIWSAVEHTVILSSTHSRIESLSYSPKKGFNRKELLSENEIRNDLKILSQYTQKLRLYSIEDAKQVVPIAKEFSFKVDLGFWIGRDKEANRQEIEEGLKIVKNYPREISTVIVGNETILRADVTIDELIEYIKEVKKRTYKLVSTAETWDAWLSKNNNKYPKEKIKELVKSVNFLTIHVLPYWEFSSAEQTVNYVKERHFELSKEFPSKRLFIGEFGWPSGGYNNKSAMPSVENQARLIVDFIDIAKNNRWNYNIVEAFDQPWKGLDEGSVGPYWGIFKADRTIKFPLSGQFDVNPFWEYQMLITIFIGLLLAIFGLRGQRVNFAHAMTYHVASQGIAFGIVMAISYPLLNYLNVGMWIMWGVGSFFMLPLVIITLAKVNELFKCTIGFPPERLVPLNLKSDKVPFVSIHIPAYEEQPHVLKETLLSLSRLHYTNYEVIVIINNTPDPYYWQPIEEYCKELGTDKFKFYNIFCDGFKAGALNEALKYSDPDTEIIAILDADYVISENWLIDLIPLFDDPKVAIVQAPQDHRDGNESIFKRAMDAEYAGFFDIGMVERNEENAIVVHGTMLLIRLNAMQEVGGWGTDTIVEDSELGLRLFEAGYLGHYTNRRYGHGLLPDTMEAFKNQRHRWAYGAIQILKKHWTHFRPSSTTLTSSQKHHFIAGWFFWLSDAFGPLMAFMNILWVPIILFVGVTIPTIPLTIPILTAFAVNILHAFVLYRTRVEMKLSDTFLSAIASMSLQLIIFKAVFDGFIKDKLPFKRTEKGGNIKNKSKNSPIKYEIILGALLILSAIALIATNKNHILEVYFFSATLVVQSVPYISAMIFRYIENYSNKNY